MFGEDAGDLLHYFYECVDDYKDGAYLYFKQYTNMQAFLLVLTRALCNAVSKFIKYHFGIDFDNESES